MFTGFYPNLDKKRCFRYLKDDYPQVHIKKRVSIHVVINRIWRILTKYRSYGWHNFSGEVRPCTRLDGELQKCVGWKSILKSEFMQKSWKVNKTVLGTNKMWTRNIWQIQAWLSKKFALVFFDEFFIYGFHENLVLGDYTQKYARYGDESKCKKWRE